MSGRHSVKPDLVSRYGHPFTWTGGSCDDDAEAKCNKCGDPAMFFGNKPFCCACEDTQPCTACGAPMKHENWLSPHEWTCSEKKCGETE